MFLSFPCCADLVVLGNDLLPIMTLGEDSTMSSLLVRLSHETTGSAMLPVQLG